jgi:hypothetical protein
MISEKFVFEEAQRIKRKIAHDIDSDFRWDDMRRMFFLDAVNAADVFTSRSDGRVVASRLMCGSVVFQVKTVTMWGGTDRPLVNDGRQRPASRQLNSSPLLSGSVSVAP